MKLIMISILLAASCVSCVGKADKEPVTSHRRHFVDSRGDFQGDIFLQWQFPARKWLVESAIIGYETGYDAGFRDRGNCTGSASPTSGCTVSRDAPNRVKFYNQAFFYAQQMTDFYRQYPDDRDLPLNYLIGMLLEPKPKTLEQIHQWVNSRDEDE